MVGRHSHLGRLGHALHQHGRLHGGQQGVQAGGHGLHGGSDLTVRGQGSESEHRTQESAVRNLGQNTGLKIQESLPDFLSELQKLEGISLPP